MDNKERAGFETPSQRLEEISRKLDDHLKAINLIQSRLGLIQSQLDRHTELFGMFAAGMQRSGAFSPEDIGRLVQETAKSISISEIKMSNPLTPGEINRLNHYLVKARQGSAFLPEEAQDFRDLGIKARNAHPENPNWAPLAALAAFIFGLWLGSKIFKK